MKEKLQDGNRICQTVVFIFYDPERDAVLLEKRASDFSFANTLLFPGGSIEPVEQDSIAVALIREIEEELGVTPTSFEPIPSQDDIYGETGKLLKPYFIRQWEGSLPEAVLDKGNPLLWQEIGKVSSELESMRLLISALKAFLRQSAS